MFGRRATCTGVTRPCSLPSGPPVPTTDKAIALRALPEPRSEQQDVGRSSLVQDGCLLRAVRPRLPGRQRRRQRRLPWPQRAARLPAVARRRLHLAAPDLPVAAARRRLRRGGLLLDPARLRHARGLL